MLLNAPRPTPRQIVESDGSVNVGWFEAPFGVVNFERAPAAHLLSGLRGSPFDFAERLFKRFRMKRWHYTSVATPKSFFACAIVDAGYVGTAFAYVVDLERGTMHEWTTLQPFARAITIAPNSVDGRTSVDVPGWGRIVLDNDKASGTRRIEARLEGRIGRRRKPPFECAFTINDAGQAPVVVVEEAAAGRWFYTHKNYGLRTEGTLRCGELREDTSEGLSGIDWNCGYRATETYWNWAAATGRSVSGDVVGFNLTAHRHWESPEEEEDAADCALWLGGERIKLPRIEFDYNHDNLMAPWRIHDAAGLVDLVFQPDGERHDDINFGLVVSQFHQPYGRFSGTLAGPSGARFELDGVYGVTEQHFARW